MNKTKLNTLSDFVFHRTYARTKEDGSLETFEEAIDRVVAATDTQLKVAWDKGEKELFRELLLNLKGSVAGRFLWQLGTATVDKLGLASLQNCAAVVIDHPVRPFTWAFDMLMLGSGVGYNLQLKNIYSLPTVKRVEITHERSNDADLIVPDKREGWITLLEKVLESHFFTGKSFSYSTILIRSRGAKIRGFGGTASGDGILIEGITKISKLLNSRANKKIRPVDALDIMNIIGSIVVAGNVRRSAQIAIGDSIDKQYMQSKRWDLFQIPAHRAMSNNSVVCDDVNDLPNSFWAGYLGNGEPFGLINMRLSTKVGRLNEERFDNAVAYNPCAEQSLANMETCCLSEIFLPNIDTKEELWDTVRTLYKVNKHSLLLKCHHKETEEIVHKNLRMGIGVTGWLQATEEQISWLSETYDRLRAFDKEYSKKIGVNESIKLTTVKPSGTLSLVANVTAGIHPAYSQYIVRRVRVASNNELVQRYKDAGYPVEFVTDFQGNPDYGTVVIEFPLSYPDHTITANQLTAVQQLEWVKRAQTLWSDNAVSCTVYYKLEELDEIKEWLKKNYKDSIKTVSFLLHSDHGFKQAPLEAISKEEYDRRVGSLKAVDSLHVANSIVEESSESFECEGGACPVK